MWIWLKMPLRLRRHLLRRLGSRKGRITDMNHGFNWRLNNTGSVPMFPPGLKKMENIIRFIYVKDVMIKSKNSSNLLAARFESKTIFSYKRK